MSPPSIAYNEDVETFATEHKCRTEELVTTGFPRKLRLLDDLLQTEQFSSKKLYSLLEDTRAERAATTSAVDPGIQQPRGDSEEREEQVVSSPKIVSAAVSPECCSNLASPITETVGACPASVGGDGAGELNDDEAAPAARTASKRKLEDTSVPQGNNVAARSRSSPLRAHVECMIDTLRPYLLEMVEDIGNVDLWLTFLAPKFEDGNNFGVGVQASVIEYVHNARAAALDVLATIQSYRDERVLVLDNRGLRSYVEDFIRANDVLERDQFYYLRKAVRELRDHYAFLYDLIAKNWQLITEPRSEDAMPLMF